jgi:hypothetical protein
VLRPQGHASKQAPDGGRPELADRPVLLAVPATVLSSARRTESKELIGMVELLLQIFLGASILLIAGYPADRWLSKDDD